MYATAHMQTSAQPAPSQLERSLGFWSVVALGIGVTIGSGIFRTPSAIATRVPDPVLMLAVWVLGGLISLCGALSFAELASSLPYTGGLYVYLRESWGRLVAFLFGWSQLVLIRASATGAISTVFANTCFGRWATNRRRTRRLPTLSRRRQSSSLRGRTSAVSGSVPPWSAFQPR